LGGREKDKTLHPYRDCLEVKPRRRARSSAGGKEARHLWLLRARSAGVRL